MPDTPRLCRRRIASVEAMRNRDRGRSGAGCDHWQSDMVNAGPRLS